MRNTTTTAEKIYNIFSFLILLVPPSCEEGYLNVDERAALINLQLLNDSVQNVLHCRMLDAAIG